MVTRNNRNLKGALAPPPGHPRRASPAHIEQHIPILDQHDQRPPPLKKDVPPQQTPSASSTADRILAEGSTSNLMTISAQEEANEDEPDDPDLRAHQLKSLRFRKNPVPVKHKPSTPAPSSTLPARPLSVAPDSSLREARQPATITAPSRSPPSKMSARKKGKAVATATDPDFDIDRTEAIWGHHLPEQEGVLITWTDHEDDSISDAELEQLHGGDKDLQELLAWGNGEVSLPGMPEYGSREFWPSTGPFVELELDGSSSEDSNASDDCSLDSGEEDEQMLAVRGLCAFGSDSEGETTDSIDDTDHDGLVRFGIEQTDEQLQKASKKARKTQRRGSTGTTVATPAAAGPILGSFKPIAAVESVVVATSVPIQSPFSVKKVRYLRVKAASDATPSRRRTGSIASSSQSTASAPSQVGQIDGASPSPIPGIPEEEEDVYMDLDLDDILDATALHAEFELEMGDSDEPDATDVDGAAHGHGLSDLNRWNRIPIGAYRKSRAPHTSQDDSMLPAMRHGSVGLGDVPVYFPIANLLSARETVTLRIPFQYGRKRKITRQEAIGLSPIMCPIRPMPSSMKSRRQKRADRKASKRSHLLSPGPSEASQARYDSPTKSGTDVPDHEVPPLDLPSASETVRAPSEFVPSPVDLLPIPTLPSAECFPLNSPLFSAVRTRSVSHIFES